MHIRIESDALEFIVLFFCIYILYSIFFRQCNKTTAKKGQKVNFTLSSFSILFWLMAQSALHVSDDVYVYLFVCVCAVFTVHDGPVSRWETENCMAWGSASSRAAIQMAKMNLMARDSFDMVCCLCRTGGRWMLL